MVIKITYNELQKFEEEHKKQINSPLRFGQAFLNKYFPFEVFPSLFYETNYYKAKDIILENFVE